MTGYLFLLWSERSEYPLHVHTLTPRAISGCFMVRTFWVYLVYSSQPGDNHGLHHMLQKQ